MHLKKPSAIWRSFCRGGGALNRKYSAPQLLLETIRIQYNTHAPLSYVKSLFANIQDNTRTVLDFNINITHLILRILHNSMDLAWLNK